MKMKRKLSIKQKELDALIESGEARMRKDEGSKIVSYRIGDVRWHEVAQEHEERLDVINNNLTLTASRVAQANDMARQYAFMKYQYKKLFDLALKAGVIEHDGKPCAKCGSTNTTTRGMRHTTYDGNFVESWRDCLTCGNNGYMGERF